MKFEFWSVPEVAGMEMRQSPQKQNRVTPPRHTADNVELPPLSHYSAFHAFKLVHATNVNLSNFKNPNSRSRSIIIVRNFKRCLSKKNTQIKVLISQLCWKQSKNLVWQRGDIWRRIDVEKRVLAGRRDRCPLLYRLIHAWRVKLYLEQSFKKTRDLVFFRSRFAWRYSAKKLWAAYLEKAPFTKRMSGSTRKITHNW